MFPCCGYYIGCDGTYCFGCVLASELGECQPPCQRIATKDLTSWKNGVYGAGGGQTDEEAGEADTQEEGQNAEDRRTTTAKATQV